MAEEREGAEKVEEDIDKLLEAFEKKADKDDPLHRKLLEDMRAHTRALHKARGTWDKPSTWRSWNTPAQEQEVRRPLDNASYREYLKYKGEHHE
ncbi:hypothetical protein HOP50_20g86630 [Chloropicon primus]|uniref:Uncharacterized protein n=1 Tax=Chloropicon primus TaxID=1764295 RepID=A0A5B8N1D0_9CHLO|nr:hypothetical protein A3770_20p86140 [Chloropicon primus]UPR05313.1 hypothetical protein HOP50_20g86630 [Chloropicon primus]|eukprot:QDZ26096.1 hypothetical protein A3770_20p86140 [Chloropicon primus]